MSKIRLLVTEKCNKNCKGCSNKDWDLANLKRLTTYSALDMTKTSEVLITGGEPMILGIRRLSDIISWLSSLFPTANIYMYTAATEHPYLLLRMLHLLDGITLTLHNKYDAVNFRLLDKVFYSRNIVLLRNKSMRLNIFKGLKVHPYSCWNVRYNSKWEKNCPLPKDEIFMKL